MTRVRVKGFKLFTDRHGRPRCYHRRTGTAIDLRAMPIGSAEFIAECARLVALGGVKPGPRPGTIGLLIRAYRASPNFLDLAPRTRADYLDKLDYLRPLEDMPLVKMDRPFIVNVRDKAAAKGGRRFGNYVKAVLSIVLGWGTERGWLTSNPAEKIKNIRREKGAPRANRPWSAEERHAVLKAAPVHLRVPLAIGMFTGLREGDVLRLVRTAVADGVLTFRAGKNGMAMRLPIPAHLATILAEAPGHDAVTIAANSRGAPWTESGFRASWGTLRGKLITAGLVAPGLTFHGLRHTVATTLREEGVDPRVIADWLGQKTEGMALHYSREADLSRSMKGVVVALERSENKARRKIVKPNG